MKRLMVAAGLLTGLIVSSLCLGRQAVAADSSSEMPLSTTPEMWFYQQNLRLYEDSRAAVRRKAEVRAEQRQQRIASRKWYGYSNARPRANATPWGASYSPARIANSARPFNWRW